MLRLKMLSFTLLFAIISLNGITQSEAEKMYFSKEVSCTVTYGYLLQFPAGYDVGNSQAYPLLLFLHGSGERGSDLDLVKKHGPPQVAMDMNLPLTIYPDAGHDAWTETYQNPEIYTWLLKHNSIKH